MTEMTASPRSKPARDNPAPAPSPIKAAPKQESAQEAWKQFVDRLVTALVSLDEDEFLVLRIKGTTRYVQIMDQGAYGIRMETVSDFYLPEDEHLTEEDYAALMKLGWCAPTQLPGSIGGGADGSPNYYLDLARPVPYGDVAVMAALTLANVHDAAHPGCLEYDARSTGGCRFGFRTCRFAGELRRRGVDRYLPDLK